MFISLLIFSILSFLIGLCAGTVGFTAWTIVLPYLWLTQKTTLYQCLFVSVCIDAVTGITITIMNGVVGLIDFQRGSVVVAFGCLLTFIMVHFAHHVLEDIGGILKHGAGYIVIVIGIFFIVRGARMMVAKKKEERGEYAMVNEVEEDQVVSNLRLIVASCLSAIMGILSGISGIGGGALFVLVFINILKMDLKRATATGVYCMAVMMACLGTAYLIIEFPIFPILWEYILSGGISACIGSIIGNIIIQKVSDIPINFVVGLALIAFGIYGAIQPYIY